MPVVTLALYSVRMDVDLTKSGVSSTPAYTVYKPTQQTNANVTTLYIS